ncbi:hypothetical protein CM15mP35_08610 [bacterium]|nr:MAG: hypothetical protein CM15mP35_08610 [bacterium]
MINLTLINTDCLFQSYIEDKKGNLMRGILKIPKTVLN